MIENFVVFIITHGRAGNIATEKTLIRQGYTGPTYFVIDNEDKQRPQYEALYGDRVKVFDKKAYADHVDEELGYEWFLVLDDDYQIFEFRVDGEGQYSYFTMGKQLEAAIEAVLEFFKSIPAKSIALAQGGDFIGGSESSSARSAVPKRKVMNTFFCSTSRRFSFFSRLNEDVNTYLALGFTGDLFLTVMLASVVQTNTQKNPGGMSDAYLEAGTYVKSFYSVMYAPHSVKVSMMGQSNRRIHHRVNWKTAVPQIVSESCRKV